MCSKKESRKRLERSRDGISELEQLLYETAYRRKMLRDEGCDAADQAAEDGYAIIVPRVLATLLRRTRLLLFLSGCVLGLLLAELISRVLF